jgi:signal transduction histidine kinase
LRALNKELIDSEENLTLANSSKDQLISMLSHDLYNPVTSVINYTNITLESIEKSSKEDLQKALTNVNNAVIPLQDLLDNILQWARSQRQNLQKNIEEIHLNNIINDIIKLYQPLAAFKQIRIVFNPLENDLFNSDRLMVYFVLRNIINNAVKFSPKGKEICIITNITNDVLRIVINDQGKGFRPEILAQLNNPESIDLTGQISGSGIGLSTSRRFVNLLGGNIEFKNGAEEGAEIIVSLRQV